MAACGCVWLCCLEALLAFLAVPVSVYLHLLASDRVCLRVSVDVCAHLLGSVSVVASVCSYLFALFMFAGLEGGEWGTYGESVAPICFAPRVVDNPRASSGRVALPGESPLSIQSRAPWEGGNSPPWYRAGGDFESIPIPGHSRLSSRPWSGAGASGRGGEGDGHAPRGGLSLLDMF